MSGMEALTREAITTVARGIELRLSDVIDAAVELLPAETPRERARELVVFTVDQMDLFTAGAVARALGIESSDVAWLMAGANSGAVIVESIRWANRIARRAKELAAARYGVLSVDVDACQEDKENGVSG